LFPTDPEIGDVEVLARKIAYLDLSRYLKIRGNIEDRLANRLKKLFRFYGFFTGFYLDGDSRFLVKSVSLSIALYSNVFSLSYFGMGLKVAKNAVRYKFYFNYIKVVLEKQWQKSLIVDIV